MVDQRNDDNLLLLLLALILAGDFDDEPFAYDLIHRLGRSGRLREQLGPDLDYLLDRGLRRGLRSRRRDEFREFSVSLVEGLRAGFAEQTKTLAQAISGRRHNEQSLTEVASDLYDTIWLLSVGGRVGEAQIKRPVPVRVYFSDETSGTNRAAVMKALQDLLRPEGFELAYSLPDQQGSWWKRFIFRSKELLTSEEVTSRIKKAERAVEATYLDKPQAEANNLQAAAAAGLIGSLATTHTACIQVGSLLVVKATDAEGHSTVAARTLTADELKEIEENQTILREPQRILEFLQGAERRRIE